MTAPLVEQGPDKEKIKRNLARMAAQNATPEEMEAYIQSTGLQPVANAPISRQDAPQTTIPPRMASDATQMETEAPRGNVSVGDVFKGAGTALGIGATGGYGDEVISGQRALFEKHPVLGALAGAAGPVGLAAGAYAGSRMNPKTYQSTMQGIDQTMQPMREVAPGLETGLKAIGGLPLAMAIPGGPMVGGAIGGAIAGSGEAPNNRLAGGGLGLLLGGALGGGAGVLSRLGRAIVPRAPGSVAAENLDKAIVRDMEVPEAIAARQQAAGPLASQTTFGDVGGPNVRGLFEGAANLPGKGRARFLPRVTERAKEIPNMVNAALSRAGLGQRSQNLLGDAKALRKTMEQQAAPLYEDAGGAYLNASGEVRFISDKGLLKQVAELEQLVPNARNIAIKLAKAERIPEDELFQKYTVTKQSKDWMGNIVSKKVTRRRPSVRYLDYLKRGIDDAIDIGSKPGAESVSAIGDELKYAIKDRKREFLDALDALVPEFGKARAVYPKGLNEIKALQLGEDFLGANADELDLAVGKLSAAEKTFFQKGAAKAILDKVDQAASNPQAPQNTDNLRGLIGSVAKQKKLAEAFDSPKQFEQFMRELETIAKMQRTNRTLMGSRTTPLAGEIAEVTGQDLPGSSRTMAILANLSRTHGKVEAPEVADELIKMLMETDGTKVVRSLGKARFKRTVGKAVPKAIGTAGGSVAGMVTNTLSGDDR